MPLLRKKGDLFNRFEEAIRLSGWSLLYLSRTGHPRSYQVFRDGISFNVRVHIWNITHGGKGRSPDEYRIQVTGFDRLTTEPNTKTALLGWWEDMEVFGGWDIRQHLEPLGSSPSMQISQDTLLQAVLSGFAPYQNARGETAIGVRPDFMGTYLNFLDDLHDSGKIPVEAELLTRLSHDPEEVDDDDIDNEVATKRKHAIVTTKRALRAIDFSKRVLSAYEHRCAMCGIQLRLVDGAHILPVAHADSTDETSNGVALCAIHHRAYDRGLVTFASDFKIHHNAEMISTLKTAHRGEGLKLFRNGLRPAINVPSSKPDRPSRKLVTAANSLRGWQL